jgi:hypothetical protein
VDLREIGEGPRGGSLLKGKDLPLLHSNFFYRRITLVARGLAGPEAV